jgi:hypothetical protein
MAKCNYGSHILIFLSTVFAEILRTGRAAVSSQLQQFAVGRNRTATFASTLLNHLLSRNFFA